MSFSWSIFVDLGLISAALLFTTFLRSRVRFLQRYLIPNALTAGFILLPFYNFLAPRLGMNNAGLENLVFHLLNLSFVAMSLRGGTQGGAGRRIFSSAVMIITQYALQTIVGLGLTLALLFTILPDLFPSFGFLMALGFALGPGQAFAIGKGWEDSFHFAGAANLGLAFAAIGYLLATFGGIYLINLARRRAWLDADTAAALDERRVRTGIVPPGAERPVGSRLTTESEAVDTLSYSTALVLGVYLVAYLVLMGITALLSLAGSMGEQLATNFWGIAFIFAALVALLVKRIFRGLGIDYTIDQGSLTRLAGLAVDLMVTAAIAAILIVRLSGFWLPLLVVAAIGGVITTVTVMYTASRLFTDHRFQRAMMIYGNMTGTLSTGLALLRILDPGFETPAATDYMYGTGIVFVLAIPLILLLNFPGLWYSTGNALYIWLTWAGLAAYLLFAVISYAVLAGRRAFRGGFSLWGE